MDEIKAAVAARAGMDAAAVAGELNTLVFSVRRPVKAIAVKKLWTERMILARCWVIASSAEALMQARVVCRATYDALMHDTFADFDVDDAIQRAKMDMYFAALMESGAITDQDRLDTLALADAEMTGAELFGRLLDESDVLAIRKELG